MKELIFDGFYLIFGQQYTALILVAGITFAVLIVVMLAILNHWGRSY